MEIKDICVSEERMDEVRGGQNIDVSNLGLQLGGNRASSSASSYGIGNTTSSLTEQVASQQFSQATGISASEVNKDVFAITNSMVGGWGPMRVL